MLTAAHGTDEILSGLSQVVDASSIILPDRVKLLDPGLDDHNLDAGLIVAPSSVDEVRALVSWCATESVALVPHGGRTSLAGAATSQRGQLVLSTSRLNKIIELDEASGTALIEPGVTLRELQLASAEIGLSPGIDLGARDNATIGGMVSTNAGGQQSFRNGVMRHRVLGLEAVLGNGNLFADLKKVSKSNEGYALRHLLIGSEGTLGVLTKISLALLPVDGDKATALVSCRDEAAAVKTFQRLRAQPGLELLAVEFMSPGYARITAAERGEEATLAFEPDQNAVFLLLDTPLQDESILSETLLTCSEHEELSNAIFAKSETDRAKFWAIREDVFLTDRQYPDSISFDISLPVSALPDYATAFAQRTGNILPDLKVFTIGHLADGNMHLTISCGRPVPDLHDQIRRAVNVGLAEVGGSFSAEHGIGIEKRKSLRENVPAHQLDLMRSIKQLFDPAGIMNPGKVL
ncbi:MAG: FAD-binding oxidoreductase [Alphaproteobacteria bacterium]|nr:FAD-binding oxidoreductase [Alphaproteobacteria bacterium]